MEKPKTKSVSLLDMLIVLAQKKKILIIVTLIMSIISVVYVLLAQQYWISVASIKPNSSNNQTMSLSGSLLGLGSSLLGNSLTESSAEVITVMNSRRFSEKVIEEFDLYHYMGLKGKEPLKDKETALTILREQIMRYNVNPETGVITIGAETKDRELSRKIVNYFIAEIESFNQTQRNTKGKQRRLFLEKRINEIEAEMENVKLALKSFSDSTNTVSLSDQSTGIINTYINLIATKMNLDVEYSSMLGMYDSSDVRLEMTKRKIDDLTQKIESMESSSTEKYLLNIDDISSITLDYTTITARMELLTELYKFLYPQYEAARLEELKDLPTIDIIDDANLPGFRSKPLRAQFCILVFFATVLLCSTVILTNYYLPQEKKDKFLELRKAIFNKRK